MELAQEAAHPDPVEEEAQVHYLPHVHNHTNVSVPQILATNPQITAHPHPPSFRPRRPTSAFLLAAPLLQETDSVRHAVPDPRDRQHSRRLVALQIARPRSLKVLRIEVDQVRQHHLALPVAPQGHVELAPVAKTSVLYSTALQDPAPLQHRTVVQLYALLLTGC